MDEDKKKQVKIVGAIAGIVVALVVFFIYSNPFGGQRSQSAGDSVYLLCSNEDCGAAQELTKEEFANLASGVNPRLINDTPFLCPKCGQETAYKAVKCPKCGEVYFWDYEAADGFRDRCPGCGFSAMEERRNK